MSFCGSKGNALSVRFGVLSNVCFVDVLNIIPHAVFCLIGISILVAWRHSVYGKLNIVTWVHFQGHTLRWIFTIILFWLNVTEVIEGTLSDLLDPDITNYHVFVPQCAALAGTSLSIMFYHNVEMWNSPRFLLLLLIYWVSSLTCKTLKFISLTRSNIELEDLRVWLTVLEIILYCLLLLIELNVLRIQRYAFFKNKNLLYPLDEIADTRFDYSYVNFLSKTTFWWLIGLLREGYKQVLDLTHLGNLPVSEHTKTNVDKLNKAFETEKLKAETEGREPSFAWSYLRAFWPMLGLAAVFRLFGDLLGFVGPWCIESIVDYAYRVKNISPVYGNNTNSSMIDPYVHVDDFFNNGYVLSVVLFLSCLLQKSFHQNHHFLVIREAIRLRNGVQGMIYEKALRLSSSMLSSGKLSVGQILNFMSTDALFIHNLFFFINYIWAVPVQVTVAFVLLYLKLGVSAVIGGAVMILVLPFQYIVARSLSKIQKKILSCSDERMKKSTELIQAIRILKQFAWEKLFTSNVEKTRHQEMKFIFRHSILLACIDFITVATPIIGMAITFSLYTVLEDDPLTVGKVFSTVALFNVLLLPLFTLTIFLHSIVNARVSSKRLLPYFLAPEVEGLKLHGEYVTSEGTQVDGQIQMCEDLSVHFIPGDGKVRPSGRNSCQSSFRANDSAQNSASSDSLGVSPQKARKYSAPPRMMNLPGQAAKHKNSVAKSIDSTTSFNLSESPADLSPSRKPSNQSQHSSNSSNDRCDSRLATNPKMVSCSVSTEDIHVADLSGSETVVEIRNAVEVTDGHFSWEFDTNIPCLKDISVKIPTGKLTVVVGQVGSGKSSLLSVLIGEMITLSGTVDWYRGTKIAYVPQKPWILNTTLRNNILVGQPFVWKKYKRVISACSLNTDLEMLPAGDQTEIGEKGVNLSGGQKQRVSIARALYSGANTVLLDDPLSALDSHVSRHVFDAAIMRRLVNKKHTVVMVTHSVQYLSRASQIIVMKDGEMQHQGRLGEIKKADPDLYESWRLTLREVKKKEETEQKAHRLPDHIPSFKFDGISDHLNADHNNTSRRSSVQSLLSSKMLSVASGRQLSKLSVMTEASSGDEMEEEPEEAAGKRLIAEEGREIGSVKWGVYFAFIKACTVWLTVLVLVATVVQHGLTVSADFWLSRWASRPAILNSTQPQAPSTDTSWYYLRIYFILCISAVVVTLITAIVLHFTLVRAAKHLHLGLLRNIILAPIRFFYSTPSGRILNRFSSDTAVIDLKMGLSLSHLLRAFFTCLCGVLVIVIGTPYFILVIVPLFIFYFVVQRFYLTTSRELQRLESLTKSPVFSHFSETLNGLQTIRAFGLQSSFLDQAFFHIDNNTIPLLFLHSINRLMGVFLDYLGSFIAFSAAIASLASAIHGDTDPAFIGITIVYALLMCDSLNWLMRRASEIELHMNAMERIKEYTEITPEQYTGTDYFELSNDWPSCGEINFDNVSVRYDDHLEFVLKGISLNIKAGEKVGLCGRTGSGKTSLTASLFRMLQIPEGTIKIDGTDISKIPLSQLRSAITAIPQDPVLFLGSVRYNLDPKGVISDDRLWEALDKAQLKDTVALLNDKLDSQITEGGENLSVGQRQLFCFARALLRNSQILILDEATASVDLTTDQLVQKVISESFKDKTVITVAHRISTIETYDRIIVLEDGEVLEFDDPKILLENPDSHFYKLAKQNKL